MEPIRVLLVDDERSFREPLAQYVQNHLANAELVTSSSFVHAQKMVLEKPPNYFHVSIIDEVLVPEDEDDQTSGTGLELMDFIRQHSPATEHIIYTGWGTRRGLEALRAGAFHLSKLAPRDELILHIQAAAEKGKLKALAHEKQLLEQLLRGGTALLSDNSLEEVLESILKAVQTIGYDRVRLYWISADRQWLEGVAQVGPEPVPDFVGSRREVEKDYFLQRLFTNPYPQQFRKDDNVLHNAEQPSSTNNISEWVCAPLLFNDQVVGKLSVDNKTSGREINLGTFEPLMLFAYQAAAAIVTAHLRAKQRDSAEQANQRADKLEAVQRMASIINTTLDMKEIAQTACQTVVELFGVDHSGFLYIDPDLSAGVVLSEFPEIGAQQTRIPLKGIPLEEELIQHRQPVVIRDVAAEQGLNEVGGILNRFEILSILLVPVIYRERFYGSFSLDFIGRLGDFSQEQVEHCQIIADQLASALHNTELIQQLEKLHITSSAVTAELDHTVLLDSIIKQAAELLRARNAGIYEYLPDQHELIIVADFGHVNVKGRRIKEGEGMAGRLVLSDDDIITVDNYSTWEHRADTFQEEQVFGAVIEVKLKWKGQTKGVLYLDDNVGRKFSSDDKHLLQLFAYQASNALGHADIVRNLKRRTQLLNTLDQTTREILSEDEPQKLLHQIIRRAAELTNCRYAGLLINYENLFELELQNVHGLPHSIIGSRVSYDDPVLGSVACMAQPRFIRPDDFHHGKTETLWLDSFKLVAGSPLIAAGKVEAVLFVADSETNHPFNNDDLDVLERFAATATIALQRADALDEDKRGYARLKLLHSISDFMQKGQNLEQIFHVFLTGITAGYGLGFNRAALFLLNNNRTCLEGKMGIGHLSYEEVQKDWKRDQLQKTDNIESYYRSIRENALPSTPVGEAIRTLPELSLGDAATDLFAKAVQEDQFQLITDANLDLLPESFTKAFEPAAPGIILTLRARNEVIGLVVADNKFTKVPITRNDIDSFLAFAETAAAAIDGIALLRQTEEARERLGTFFRASTELVLTEQPEAVLSVVVERACQAAEAHAASLLIIDESRRVQDHYSIGLGKIGDVEQLARLNGFSAKIMDLRKPFPLENCDNMREQLNPSAIWQPIKAAVGLPVILQSKAIGVLWIYYHQYRHFSQGWLDALQLYANHAAIVYDNVRRINELTGLRMVAEKLADTIDPTTVLNTIVKYACQVLRATSACLYPLDTVRQKLIWEKSVFHGIEENLIIELKKDRPLQLEGTTNSVLEKGWLGVEDITDERRYRFIGPNTRGFLQKIGARSFQGIAVQVGDKPLGVLYVNYDRRRFFGETERQTAEAFAHQAAAALENAQLGNKIRQARFLAGEVARVTVLGNFDETLQSVANYTKKATESSAVVVYSYDQERGCLSHKPAMSGVNYPGRVSPIKEVKKSSLVWKMLKRKEIYISKPTNEDPFFKNSRFTNDEEIKTAVAVPLRYGQNDVGVMFVNYRQPHRLGEQEKDDILLFANQAAVAIYNVQTHEKLKDRIDELKRQDALLQSRTDAAWVGMMSSTWTHRMNSRLATIQVAIQNIRHDFQAEKSEAILPRLDNIEVLINELLHRPVVPDLGRENVESVPVNQHLRDRLEKMWTDERYNFVELVYDTLLPQSVAIRADPYWLRRAYNILIDNAVEAMVSSPSKKLTVTTKEDKEWVEICFSDTGCGIPEEIIPILFQRQIPKEPDSRGWGTGLLLARLIFETYGGTIECNKTDLAGTEMVLRFPKESG